jgi:hypothetical protein
MSDFTYHLLDHQIQIQCVRLLPRILLSCLGKLPSSAVPLFKNSRYQQPRPLTTAPAQASMSTETVKNSSPPRAVQRGGSSRAASQNPLVNDASTREGGEISENEDPPFRPSEKSILASTMITAPYAAKPEPSGSVQSRSPFAPRSHSPLRTLISTPPHPPLP